MLLSDSTLLPLARKAGAHDGAQPSDPASDWLPLLLEVQQGLRLGAASCFSGQDPVLAHRVHERLMGSLAALDRLQDTLQGLALRCRQSELASRESLAALAVSQAELVGTQDGERRARHQALHDALTGLPNGQHFREHLEQTLRQGGPLQPGLAVFYLDLDGFKAINDLHGHEAGDELLKIVATRLGRSVRSEDMVSRLGGDEFACLRQGLHEQQQWIELAHKLHRAVAAPMKVGGLRLTVTASIGIAISPEDGESAATLLRNADAAMYSAKRAGSNFAFFDHEAARPSDFGSLALGD